MPINRSSKMNPPKNPPGKYVFDIATLNANTIINNLLSCNKLKHTPVIQLKLPQLKTQNNYEASNLPKINNDVDVLPEGQLNKPGQASTSKLQSAFPQKSTVAQNSKAIHIETRTCINNLGLSMRSEPKPNAQRKLILVNPHKDQCPVKNADKQSASIKILENRTIKCSSSSAIDVSMSNNINDSNSEEVCNIENSKNIVGKESITLAEYAKYGLKALKTNLKSLVKNTTKINSTQTETNAEKVSLDDIDKLMNDPLITKINSEHRKQNDTGHSLCFVTRLPSHNAINNDHCYLKQMPNEHKLSDLEPTPLNGTTQNDVSAQKTKQWRYPQFVQCIGHDHLPELQDEYAVKLGDKFASNQAFTEYVNSHAKRWRLYYSIIYSRDAGNAKAAGRKDPSGYVCIYSKERSKHTYYINKGLRRGKQRFKSDCPSRIQLTRINGDDHLTVVYICHHHDHPLTEELFYSLPHCHRLPPDIKEEMYDLISLDVNLPTVAKYITSRTGLPISCKNLQNIARKIRNKIIKRQFSADKLKELMEKVKSLRENYGENNQDQTEGESTHEVSTLSVPSPAEQTPVKKRSKKLDRTDDILNSYEEFSQLLKPTTERKKKQTTDPGVENQSHNSVENQRPKKRSSRKRQGVPEKIDATVNKRSRLEERLESMYYDQEVMQSVRELQESVRCSSKMELRHTSPPSQPSQNDYLITPQDLEVSTHNSDNNFIDNIITDEHVIFESYDEDIRFDIITQSDVDNVDKQDNMQTITLQYADQYADQVEIEHNQDDMCNDNYEQQHDDANQYNNANEIQIHDDGNNVYNVNEPENETVILYSDECGDINELLQSMEHNDLVDYSSSRPIIETHEEQARVFSEKDNGIQTQPSITKQTELTETDDSSDDEIINKNKITYVDSNQRTVVEEYVTKYNIHQYMVQSTFRKYIEHLAKDLKMNVTHLLGKLYNNGGVIKIVSATDPRESSTIKFKFLKKNTPIRIEDDTLTELERCKAEASMYYRTVQLVTGQIKTNMAYVKSVNHKFTEFEKLTKVELDSLETKLKDNGVEISVKNQKINELQNVLNLERKNRTKLEQALQLLKAQITDMERNLQKENIQNNNLRSELKLQSDQNESLNKQLKLQQITLDGTVNKQIKKINILENDLKLERKKKVEFEKTDMEHNLQKEKIENINLRSELKLQRDQNKSLNKQMKLQRIVFGGTVNKQIKKINILENDLKLERKKNVEFEKTDMEHNLPKEKILNNNLRSELKLQSDQNESLNKQMKLQQITLGGTINKQIKMINILENDLKLERKKNVEFEKCRELQTTKIVDNMEKDLRMENIETRKICNDLKGKLEFQQRTLHKISSLINEKHHDLELLKYKMKVVKAKSNNSQDDNTANGNNNDSNDNVITTVCDHDEKRGVREELNTSIKSPKDNLKIQGVLNYVQSVQGKARVFSKKEDNVCYNLEKSLDETSVVTKNNSTLAKPGSNTDQMLGLDATNDAIINISSSDKVNSIISSHDNIEPSIDVPADLDETNFINSSHGNLEPSIDDTVNVDETNFIISSHDNLEPKIEDPADHEATPSHEYPPPLAGGPDPLSLDEDVEDKPIINTNIDEELSTNYSNSYSKYAMDSSKPQEISQNTLGIRVKSVEDMMSEYTISKMIVKEFRANALKDCSKSTEPNSSSFTESPQVMNTNNQEDLPSIKQEPDVGRGEPSPNWPPRLQFLRRKIRPLLTYCEGHGDQYHTDNLPVKPGFKFKTHADFNKHLFDNGKIHFNCMSVDRSLESWAKDCFTYTCSYFANLERSKRASYPDSDCPCKIVLRRLDDDGELTVSYICNHHNHLLAEVKVVNRNTLSSRRHIRILGRQK